MLFLCHDVRVKGIVQQYPSVARRNRPLCQWKCQQIAGWKQMWYDHKEGCWLHNSKG